MSNWWGTHDRVSSRLRVEVEAMRLAFGDTFKLHVVPSGRVYWLGTVEINLATLRNPRHTVRIEYPETYPQRPPEAYPVEPRVVSQKHQYTDGQLCLFNPQDGRDYGWDPARSTAVAVAGWAIQWYYAYYTWRSTGTWPGVEERAVPREGFS